MDTPFPASCHDSFVSRLNRLGTLERAIAQVTANAHTCSSRLARGVALLARLRLFRGKCTGPGMDRHLHSSTA